jgi:hypothetical protein
MEIAVFTPRVYPHDRVKNGKFIESWGNWDVLGLKRQLGVLPAETKGRAA